MMARTGHIFTALLIPLFASQAALAAELRESGYLAEAAVPLGWPEPATAGVVVRARLPETRAAASSGFWPLFMHISNAGIPMTAPVVMDVPGQPASVGMRFLYPSASTPAGATTSQVRVVDVPGRDVLKVAWRGDSNRAIVARYQEALDREAAALGLRADGPSVLFGYNGPSTPRRNRTWELALPVVAVTAATTAMSR